MRTLFYYIAVAEHKDEVSVLDGTEPVGYDKACAVAGERVHGALGDQLGTCVDAARGFVEDEHVVVLNHCPGNGQQLFLTGGDSDGVVQHGVETLGQGLDEMVDAAGTAGVFQLLIRDALFVVDKIVARCV